MGAETDTLHQPFFFVNKTAKSTSLSHGKPDEAFFIQSYVQSRVRRQKRSAKQMSTSVESTATEESSPGTTAIVPMYQEPTTSPITLEEVTYKLLQYPMSNFIINDFSAESLSLVASPVSNLPFRHREAVITKLQRCMQDEMLLYGALANSASCIRWAVGSEPRGQQPEHYMLKAIGHLKRQLRQGRFDRWSLLCMLDIGMADFWNGNFDAAAAHLKMIGSGIDRVGGLETLDPYILETLILADKYLALRRGSPPVLSIEVLMPEVRPTVPTTAYGTAFFESGSETLNPLLASILEDIILLLGQMRLEEEHALFLRHQIVFYRLLHFKADSRIDEVCRLGTITWLLKLTSSLQAGRAAKELLPLLRKTLEWTPSDGCAVSICLWTATVGAQCAEFMEERSWFIRRAAELGLLAGVSPEKSIYAAFLKGFFFLPSEQHGLQFKRMVLRIRDCG